MKNQSFRIIPAKKCGRVFYQIRPSKVSRDARILALLLEIAELLKK